MTEISKEQISIILDLLSSEGILKKRVKLSSIANIYDLWGVIINECEEYTTEVWPEDFGTERDAGEDYESILRLFEKLSHGNIKYEAISSTTKGDNVELNFMIQGKKHTIKFEQYSDGFSEEFIESILEATKDCEKGRIVEYSAGDVPEFVYVPHEVADILTQQDEFN
ncbi:MAG: hypothetical protein P8179_21750 [Candidatus Thiodiazotropha sp.]